MKRAGIISFAYLYLLLGVLPGAFAQQPYITTVSIDNCRLDYQDVNLSLDRELYQAQWVGLDQDKVYVITWHTHPGCTIAYFPASAAKPSPVCSVLPVSPLGYYRYDINWKDSADKPQTCPPARVVVNDGQALILASTSGRKLLSGPTNLPKQRIINIDEGSMPSATPNLYISDQTSLVWTSQIITPSAPTGVTFTIDFGARTPCLDSSGAAAHPAPTFRITSEPAGPNHKTSNVCYVNTKPGAVGSYKYTVTSPISHTTYSGFVNVVP